MVLVDTGALYALLDRNDAHHRVARDYHRTVAGKIPLVVTLPTLTESWLLSEARLGSKPANALWKSATHGAFEIIDVTVSHLEYARQIEHQYADAKFGFVDCVSMAVCEAHKIEKVFTFDRRHFSIYRPKFTKVLELVPA